MSQTKTILSYIHQNFKVHNREPGSEPLDTKPKQFSFHEAFQKQLSPPQKTRKPLAHRFPFNQCDDVSLKQSRESIMQGVRLSNKQYRKHTCELQQLYTVIQEEYGEPNVDTFDIDLDSDSHELRDLRQKLQLPSILLKHHETSRDTALENFHKALLAILQKRLGVRFDLSEDIQVREALNYASNLFLQNSRSSANSGPFGSSEIADGISLLAYDFIDKYEEISLDAFEDAVFDGTTEVLLQEPGQTPEKPVFFEVFENIWKLDPPNLLEFRVDVFIDEYEGMLSHQYSIPQLADICINYYGESALKMNISRFYWAYRERLHAQKVKKLAINFEDMDKAGQFDIVCDIVDQLTQGGRERHAAKPKSKSLRFADLPLEFSD